MEHFICNGGCRSVSEGPGYCRVPECPRNGEPLEKCDCKDGEHYGAFYTGNDDNDNHA